MCMHVAFETVEVPTVSVSHIDRCHLYGVLIHPSESTASLRARVSSNTSYIVFAIWPQLLPHCLGWYLNAPFDKFHLAVILVIGPSSLGSMPPPGSIGSVHLSTTPPGSVSAGVPMSGAPCSHLTAAIREPPGPRLVTPSYNDVRRH